MAPKTHAQLLHNLRTSYPEILAALPGLKFIEQYNPDDLRGDGTQPFAYICDQVHEVELGLDIDEVRGKGVGNEEWVALAELRDKIAPGEKVGWFVVVCGDVERGFPGMEENGIDKEEELSAEGGYKETTMNVTRESTDDSLSSPVTRGTGSLEASSRTTSGEHTKPEEPKGIKKWLNKARKARR